MTERRDFLKVAGFLPLSALTGIRNAQATDRSDGSTIVEMDSDIWNILAAYAGSESTDTLGEKEFNEYHLLGVPDASANLFGDSRPQNWSEAKLTLISSLRKSAKGDDPIHDWVAVFNSNFEDLVTDAAIQASRSVNAGGSAGGGLRYEPQLYDGLLRSAAALLDRCLRYRLEMAQFEVSGVTAGIGYLTYLKVRPLQRNFIVASNSANLAHIEKVASEHARDKYAEVFGLDRIFERYQLLAKQIELSGSAAEASLAEEKNNLITNLLERQFNIQSDAQLAVFTRMFQAGSANNFAERYEQMRIMLADDLADAYCRIYSVAKGVQSTLGLSEITIATNQPVSSDIPLFTDANAVAAWASKIMTSGGSSTKEPDLLDALVLWTRAVMRALDTLAQFESEFTVSIPLTQARSSGVQPIVSSAAIATAFTGANPTGVITFNLPSSALPIKATVADVRVLGIGLSAEHSKDDASPLQYTTSFPASAGGAAHPTASEISAAQVFEQPRLARLNATVSTPPQTLQGIGTYNRPIIFLPNVRIQGGSGGDFEPIMSYEPGCRGLNPFGSWVITFDPNMVAFYQSDTPVPPTWVAGLILHLRLRATLS